MLTIRCFIHQLQAQLILHCCNKTLITSPIGLTNLSAFNVQKCKFMHIYKKDQMQLTCFTPNPLGQPLEKVYKYLGLLLSSDLSCTQHINNICTKAKKLLGLIYHRFYQFSTPGSLFQMHISLVHPNLEYASQVLEPIQGPRS